MYEQSENTTSLPLTSSAEASPAKTSLPQARERALAVLAAACGTSIDELCLKYGRPGWWSKMWPAAQRTGLTKCAATWNSSAMKAYRSRCRRSMSELRIFENEFSLWHTPSSSSYGSNQGGAAGRTGKKRLGLHSLAHRGLLATPTTTANQLCPSMAKWPGCAAWQVIHPTGPLRPSFVEWMMGFPTGWTVIVPSVTP